MAKNPPAKAGDMDLVPGSEEVAVSPGSRKDNLRSHMKCIRFT